MTQLQHARFESEVRLVATAARAWTMLTERLDAWWCEPLRRPETQAVQLDVRVGGLLWEDLGSGSGVVRGTVREVIRGELLVLDGGFDLAGAVSSQVTFRIAEHVGERTLSATQVALGEFSDDELDDQRAMWRSLLGSYRRVVDGSAPPPPVGRPAGGPGPT
ncbi:MAG: hypothetical protein AAGA17_09020 [Actinomycetota bacterium]